MAGKRVAQPQLSQEFLDEWGLTPKKKKSARGGWIAFGVIAAILVGSAAALGAYANGYDRVFPGVTLGEESLAGLTREELTAYLESGALLSGQVSVTADGEDLGRYTQQELGAYIESGRLADAAWSVGREEGAAGWFQNAWTMLTGVLGGRTGNDVEVHYDAGALRAAAEKMGGFMENALPGESAPEPEPPKGKVIPFERVG